ncbi:MAG: hypothetical protein AB7P35_15650 [Hyphomonadaceae bacterium]
MPELTPIAGTDERLERALAAGVPCVYINGFNTVVTNSDIVLVGERTGQPAVVLNLSYTMAKTLALALTNAVSVIEEKAGREIMTTIDLDRFLGV